MLALIVDDELEIRERLRTQIPWADYGVEKTVVADDGDTALDMLDIARARMPDLVVTDIRMSRTSGLELLERLTAERPTGWKGIVISG